jgi:DNA-binding response OmpR family regulator
LLVYMCENEKVVLKRENILDAVWGFDYDGDMRTVDTLVKQLRKKMTDKYPYITSVYGVGYRFEVK